MTAVLRPIPGWAGYFAGDDGSVWALHAPAVKPFPRRLKEYTTTKILCVCAKPDGGRARSISAGRLVALAFHGEPAPHQIVVRHLNGNFRDNRPANLAWGTQRQNVDDDLRNGVRPHGERHRNAALTESDVRRIPELVAAGKRNFEIARALGVSQSVICNIRSGRAWRHITKEWS